MARLLSICSALSLACLMVVCATTLTQAQTFSVIHSFTNQGDGFDPVAGLTLGAGGKLYGTTSSYPRAGTAFEMKPSSGGWTLTTLSAFNGTDGRNPSAALVFGPGGALYGTTSGGGTGASGVVYSIRPPSTFCRVFACPWSNTVAYSFNGQPDGSDPYTSGVSFDAAGNIYGTTVNGGSAGLGSVFQLTRAGSGWTESVILNFTYINGQYPENGVIVDNAGNLYGVAALGGATGNGMVYKLTRSGSGWTQTVLFDFSNRDVNGCVPIGGLIFDQAGNLYGTTQDCGPNNNGTVFELSPSGSGWNYTVLYSFGDGVIGGDGGPEGSLAMNSAGNLYGTTYSSGAHGFGSVFKLTRSGSNWIYSSLHDFTGGSDGANPFGGPVVDASGNVYGTASMGGVSGLYCQTCGVVWQVTQ